MKKLVATLLICGLTLTQTVKADDLTDVKQIVAKSIAIVIDLVKDKQIDKATRNQTLIFTNLKGDVVLDKIMSGSNETLVMFVSNGHIQLVNSRLSVVFNINTDESVVDISNCTFSTSCVGYPMIDVNPTQASLLLLVL